MHKSTPAVMMLCGTLLLLPQALSKSPTGNRIQFGLPRVLSGDEPHYLLMINSLLEDGDLDLYNNYKAVHGGSAQAGQRFAGTPLDHQTYWYVNGKRIFWGDVYKLDKWGRDDRGVSFPVLKDTVLGRIVSDRPEYCAHPPGLALVCAALLWPLKNVPLREPAALFLSAVVTILAMLLFRLLAGKLADDPSAANMATVVTFLGTAVWHYGRTLYCEPWLVFCCVGAYALIIAKGKALLPGLLFAIAILLKSACIVIAAPIVVFFAVKKKWKPFVLFCVPCISSVVAIGVMNFRMNGSFFSFGIPFSFGNPLEGAAGLWFSPNIGLLSICPSVLGAILVWPVFLRKQRTWATLLLLSFLLYFTVIALWTYWSGGEGFGPRLIIPVVPLLMLSLVCFNHLASRIVKAAVIGLSGISIAINALGAILSWQFLFRNPLLALLAKLGIILK